MGSIGEQHDRSKVPPNTYDALIIGAGINGVAMLYHTLKLGMKVKILEAGDGVGGVWFWNRYPGARFDSESYSYGYSWSQEVLDEWDWTEHFSPQPQTEKYINFVVDKFNMRDQIQLHSRVTKATYRDADKRWTVEIDNGETFDTKFFITAVGPLNKPCMPKMDGIERFKGQWTHTARWPKEGLDYAGKRVAVIGTGATGVQTITEVAKTAGQLYVFQRRPNWCAPLHNSPISKEEMAKIRQRYPEIFKRCSQSIAGFMHTPDSRGTLEVTDEEREAFYEHLYASPGFGIWQGNFRDMLYDQDANNLLTEFMTKKIRGRVHDPKVAEKLIPTDHGCGALRMPMESGYYEVYNQPNVELIDNTPNPGGTPITTVTETGVQTTAKEYEVDIIIYATGFDAVTGAFNDIDIRGKAGRSLREYWKEGPHTYLGVSVEGFPNMLMVAGPHTSLGNIPRSCEFTILWLARLLDHMNKKGLGCIEATRQGVKNWTNHVKATGRDHLVNHADSWLTGINRNIEGRDRRVIMRYTGGAPEYREKCEEIEGRRYDTFAME
ncbi:hypothetical protein FE257_008226 [Aspergillus nanangensis]|uniref:Cyclohexanone monooxygenase n=1 Tax=Aspergillus nanangensis TaxID=2582783 RepID=A0AAD4CNL1_ASPNN|nr:hypothetical protein FE257_008226 [Aspergillus nanangensis]